MFKKMFTRNTKVSMMSRGYTAFTLAEVLITLGIIGVVASITIPILQNEKKQEYVSELKKFYSIFSNGMKMIMVNTNCSDMACTGIKFNMSDSTDADINTANDYPKVFLDAAGFKVVKECRNVGNEQLDQNTGCWTPTKSLDGSSPISLDFMPNKSYEFILADGMAVDVADMSYGFGNCSSNATAPVPSCMIVNVDVNGSKKPNRLGRDVFSFWLAKNGVLVPRYAQGTAVYNSGQRWSNSFMTYACPSDAKSGFSGVSCAARIMEQGWQMNY